MNEYGSRFVRTAFGIILGAALVACDRGAVAADGDFAPAIRAQLTAREHTTISSETSARIDRLNATIGKHFKKGDVLVVFECGAQRAQTEKARAELDEDVKKSAAQQHLMQLKSSGQLEVDIAAAEVRKAQADLAAADELVSKCTIAAPFSGVISELKAREFQYATPGQPLLDILNDHDLDVEFVAPSRSLMWLKPGISFDFKVDETAKTYPATVVRLGGQVDPVSQSIRVIGQIVGAAPELMPGMSGSITMHPAVTSAQ